MKKKSYNDIAKIEKAIKNKYGEEAIQNPKKSWDEEKEKKYLKDLKYFHEKKRDIKKETKQNGFTIRERDTNKKDNRVCPVCGSYSFSREDDLYMAKFQCCFQCYVQYVEDREERWKSGWRPNS